MTYIKDLSCSINQALTILSPREFLGYPAKKGARGVGTMWAKLARAAFLVVLALMVVSWAISASKSKPVEPTPDDDQVTGSIFS
jgi:hypothetical protein